MDRALALFLSPSLALDPAAAKACLRASWGHPRAGRGRGAEREDEGCSERLRAGPRHHARIAREARQRPCRRRDIPGAARPQKPASERQRPSNRQRDSVRVSAPGPFTVGPSTRTANWHASVEFHVSFGFTAMERAAFIVCRKANVSHMRYTVSGKTGNC
jgi:hypothetical protein